MLVIFLCFFVCSGDPRYLHVLTHSFPTRRSSDLRPRAAASAAPADAPPPNRLPRTGMLPMEGSAAPPNGLPKAPPMRLPTVRSEEHTSELQSLMRISYAVFCLKKKNNRKECIILEKLNTV